MIYDHLSNAFKLIVNHLLNFIKRKTRETHHARAERNRFNFVKSIRSRFKSVRDSSRA